MAVWAKATKSMGIADPMAACAVWVVLPASVIAMCGWVK